MSGCRGRYLCVFGPFLGFVMSMLILACLFSDCVITPNAGGVIKMHGRWTVPSGKFRVENDAYMNHRISWDSGTAGSYYFVYNVGWLNTASQDNAIVVDGNHGKVRVLLRLRGECCSSAALVVGVYDEDGRSLPEGGGWIRPNKSGDLRGEFDLVDRVAYVRFGLRVSIESDAESGLLEIRDFVVGFQ